MFLLKDLKMVRLLGEGTFGKVFLVSFEGLGPLKLKRLYALKVMSKAKLIKSSQEVHVYNEKTAMLTVRSPLFVRLYATFQDDRHLYMVMEYVPGGELFSHMRYIAKFTISQARFYIAEILMALEVLHDHGIVYRDLKPENILLAENGHIKLADFGFSKRICGEITWTLCGTPEYLAPEIILNQGHSFEVDFWSLGVILYEMIVGIPPFYHHNQVELCKLIIRGEIGFPAYVDFVTRDIIKRLLTQKRTRRLGSFGGPKMIKKHAFFKDINWNSMHTQQHAPPIIPAKPTEDEVDPDFSPTVYAHIARISNEPPVIDATFDQY